MQILSIISLTVLLIFTTGCASTSKEVDSAKKQESDRVNQAKDAAKYVNLETYEVYGTTYYVKNVPDKYKQRGQASWYGHPFHGRRTASGERFDMHKMTAAHSSIPLPAYMRVTHLGTGKSIIVRVNDWLPRHKTRIIDLSSAAAKELGMHRAGVASVEIERVHLQKVQ